MDFVFIIKGNFCLEVIYGVREYIFFKKFKGLKVGGLGFSIGY